MDDLIKEANIVWNLVNVHLHSDIQAHSNVLFSGSFYGLIEYNHTTGIIAPIKTKEHDIVVMFSENTKQKFRELCELNSCNYIYYNVNRRHIFACKNNMMIGDSTMKQMENLSLILEDRMSFRYEYIYYDISLHTVVSRNIKNSKSVFVPYKKVTVDIQEPLPKYYHRIVFEHSYHGKQLIHKDLEMYVNGQYGSFYGINNRNAISPDQLKDLFNAMDLHGIEFDNITLDDAELLKLLFMTNKKAR